MREVCLHLRLRSNFVLNYVNATVTVNAHVSQTTDAITIDSLLFRDVTL